jgi:transposase
MRKGITIEVSIGDRTRLEAVVADRNSPQKHVWRAGIILATADGFGTAEIMRRTGKSKPCVWRWQARFMAEGVDGLLRDKTRPSRIPPLGPEVAERVVALTLTDPPAETTHWTAAMMAKAAGISVSSVQRIWRAHGLQPHRVRQFKLSNDPRFVEKLRDVVGLYIDPPAHAIVLSVDEKSQIQALDRTQPGLPMKKGRAGRHIVAGCPALNHGHQADHALDLIRATKWGQATHRTPFPLAPTAPRHSPAAGRRASGTPQIQAC